ncbi:MAG: ATP-grasp domain-containing protein, partial [Candidatus Bathyarchaeota archaeon]|nr:ATP-grasp domain-containing protein [Candidatus Bathyarchaeota archaeon]
MRLLVYEHVSGGGFADELITASFLSEGFAMLRTLISDFKAAGHKVTTTLDSRIARLNPPIAADCIIPVSSSDQTQVAVQKIAESADAAYVIAPETDGALQSFVKLVEKTGVASLNCTSAGIEKVSEKIVFHKFMKNLGMPLPETKFFSIADDLQEIKKAIRSDLNFPVIFKPADGVSCIGLSIARNEEQVAGAIGKIKGSSLNKHFLIQELIKGTASSVSLLSSGSTAVSISLNHQDVTIGTPDSFSSYSGGVAPFDHPLQNKTFKVAEKLVKSVPELRGYIGVDFVLSENGLVAIEINPRLT